MKILYETPKDGLNAIICLISNTLGDNTILGSIIDFKKDNLPGRLESCLNSGVSLDKSDLDPERKELYNQSSYYLILKKSNHNNNLKIGDLIIYENGSLDVFLDNPDFSRNLAMIAYEYRSITGKEATFYHSKK